MQQINNNCRQTIWAYNYRRIVLLYHEFNLIYLHFMVYKNILNECYVRTGISTLNVWEVQGETESLNKSTMQLIDFR